ncbi:hypothetical protein V6N13_023545 [Hibiscus sabdariffa]|uniref:Uncharacterized protein n=1 Tax=Hibiscus sabdariffa TaxID=183260 RepID=A0ABR2PM53_9ROSI
MPSGSKKRKAAKKKKEQQAANNPHGNDDMRSQDGRDSDETDVGSPASQGDHNHQHPFNHGEEERKRAPSPVGSHVTEEKSVEETARDAKSTGKSGLDEVGGAARVRVQRVELDKSSSCSSSSDDESRASEKKSEEEAYSLGSEETSYGNNDKSVIVMSMKVAENGSHEDVNGNSEVEVTVVENLVKTVTEEVGNSAEIPANKPVSVVVESWSKESEAELLPTSNGISGVELDENEAKISTSSSTPPAETNNVAEKTRDAEPHDQSNKQPLVAPTPLTVRRASLFSCCGLFDIVTGSNR